MGGSCQRESGGSVVSQNWPETPEWLRKVALPKVDAEHHIADPVEPEPQEHKLVRYPFGSLGQITG